MSLSSKQCKELRAKAHHLKPVVRIGQKGLSDNVIAETDQALEIHELIKVHIASDERDNRKQAATQLAAATGAEKVGEIGKICILYRKKTSE